MTKQVDFFCKSPSKLGSDTVAIASCLMIYNILKKKLLITKETFND